ncbi:MAG: sigma-70 family RNA polymerase sigma factor [bacterium]|nr:sigma-70 family RNA polymerase sigma factor [bacterium]
MSERELIARAKAGDFSAFSALIDKHKSRIYGLARKLAGNDQDAEDIMQDTFLKAIDKIGQFRGEAAFGTWLYSIALNEGRSLLSKQKWTELQPVEAYLPSGGSSDMHSEQAARLFDWKDPHKLLEQEELRAIIDNAIAELPYQYRVAFLLRYSEELSIKEISELIGESVAATKSRVLRARLALRDTLSSSFEVKYAKKV